MLTEISKSNSMKIGLSRSRVVSCLQTDGRKDEVLLTVAAQGYGHKNRNICSFSSPNTHVDELRGTLQERTDMNA